MAAQFTLGIAGGSASGKSTFAARVAESLNPLAVHVIGMDRYFLKEKPVHIGPLTGREWQDHNSPACFDLDGLVRDMGGIEETVLIVEGLMTLVEPRVRERCDLKLFVDASPDERIVRRLRRNMAKGASFDDVADFYLESVRFRHHEFVEPSRWYADLVVNGTSPHRHRGRGGGRSHPGGTGPVARLTRRLPGPRPRSAGRAQRWTVRWA